MNTAAYIDSEPLRRKMDFELTQWSIVHHAVGGGALEKEAALASLCQIYWFPLYAYLRKTGRSPEDAEDLVQGFLPQLLGSEGMETIDSKKGRFRSFLLASLKNYVSNQNRSARAKKRGGEASFLCIGVNIAEEQFCHQLQINASPDKCYAQEWGRTLLGHVLALLAREFEASGKPQLFTELSIYLAGDTGLPSYELMGDTLGLSKTAIAMTVHRMRRRFGELLRSEILKTVNSQDEIEEEIQYLFRTFSN